MKASMGARLLTACFAVLGLNAVIQVAMRLAGGNTDPTSLTLFQLASGTSAFAAAVGAWKRASWGPEASLAFGLITGAMLVSLPYILGLEPEARTGVFSGALVVLLFGVASGWYLHRQHRANVS